MLQSWHPLQEQVNHGKATRLLRSARNRTLFPPALVHALAARPHLAQHRLPTPPTNRTETGSSAHSSFTLSAPAPAPSCPRHALRAPGFFFCPQIFLTTDFA